MWSTNTAPDHGLCDDAANAVNPTHSGSVYTLISAGKLTVQVDEPARSSNSSAAGLSFGAEMNLAKGSLLADLYDGAGFGLRTERWEGREAPSIDSTIVTPPPRSQRHRRG
jgi:hypothetical protein